MPKTGNDKNLTADAASYNTTDLKIDTDSVQGQHYSAYAASVSNASLSPGTLPTGTVTATDTSVSFKESSKNKNGKVAYFEFQVGINVPAWQEYEVSFDVAYAMNYTLPGFTNTMRSACGIYMYKPDISDPNFAPLESTLGIKFTNGVTPTVSNSNILSVVGTASGSGACSKNMTLSSGDWTLRNESSAEKTYTFTLAMVMTTESCLSTNSCYTIINNFSATLQNTKVKVETLALTTDSDTGLKADADTQTYTGSGLSFDVFYDTTCIDQTTVVCVDRHGNTIGASDYNLNVTNGAGTFTATTAGTYTLTFELNSAAAAAGITWWDDTADPKTITLKIDPIEVEKLISPAKQIYNGNIKSFTVNGYDASVMTAGRKNNAGAFETNLPTGLTENASHAFDTTAAGKYTVAFRLPLDSVDGTKNNNYVWKNDTSSFITLDLEVEQRTLEFNWDYLSGLSNWTVPITQQGAFVWNYTGIPADNQPVSGETVKLQYRFYYDADGDSYASTPADSLDVKDIHDKNGAASRPQGDYSVYLVIADDTANGGVDGKNYKLGSTATLTVTLGAGKADIDQLIKQVAIGSALPVNIDGLPGLEYSIADGTEAVVTQKFDVGWGMAVDYYVLGNDFGGSAYKYEKWDGSSWINAANTNGAGKYKITVSLKIAAGKDYKFDTALIGSTTAKGFKVESVASDGLSAVVSYEVEIAKKVIDTSGFTLQYSYDQTNWKDFGSDNKTEFVDATIYVRVKPETMKPTVAGISAKFGTSVYTTGKTKQTYNVTASFTLTDSDNFDIADKPFTWTITNKQIKVDSNADWEQVDYSFDGVDYIGELLGIKGHSTYYPSVIEYEYSWYPENDPSDLHTGTGDAAAKTILTTASDTNKLRVTITVKIKPSVTDYELSGAAQTCAEFTVGSDKTPITVTTAGKATYGEIKDAAGFGVSVTKVNGGDPVAETGILGEIYAIYLHLYDGLSVDTSVTGAGTLLKDVDFANLNAGMYVIEVRLSAVAKDNYSLKNGKSLFEIEKKKIALPTLTGIEFKNDFVNLDDYLGGSYTEYKDIALIILGGTRDGVKNVGTYNATLTITNGNYCWDTDSLTPVKKFMKYALADGAVWGVDGADNSVANLEWSINPYVLKTSNWNLKGKEGAQFNIPAELTDGLDGAIQLWYYTDKASEPLGEGDELKAGLTYFVKAELLGEYKDNFIFEDSNATTSDFATYKIPQSGAAAFIGNVKDFVTKTWLGLPIWAWLAIGLAVLILLIIIIAVACKHRKSKEQRAEEKARKEEERRMRQERLEAERELARAKQEAELEKIRAQAGMAAGAGMAAMAVQQPVQQQMPVQPQMQSAQQMPVQQPVQTASADYSVLAEIKAELAEIKARQNTGAGYPQPAMQYGNDPVAAAELIRLKAENEAHMRAELERARSEAERARMEAELARVRAESRYAYPAQQFESAAAMRGGDMEKIGALAVAIWQSMNKAAEPAELKPAAETPQIAEESVSSSAMYPPDAVITTTTTVDTTQNPLRRERGENSEGSGFSDLDGFYDAYTEK